MAVMSADLRGVAVGLSVMQGSVAVSVRERPMVSRNRTDTNLPVR
jgi:hypothetical protein